MRILNDFATRPISCSCKYLSVGRNPLLRVPTVIVFRMLVLPVRVWSHLHPSQSLTVGQVPPAQLYQVAGLLPLPASTANVTVIFVALDNDDKV